MSLTGLVEAKKEPFSRRILACGLNAKTTDTTLALGACYSLDAQKHW